MRSSYASLVFFKKWANPSLFFIYFRVSNHITNFTTNSYVKNVHPVYGAGIRTHSLWNMSLLPLPLDQGSHLGISVSCYF